MRRLVVRRLALGVLTLWLISLVVFAAVLALPGDAATAILGREATPDRVAALRAQLHLEDSADQPVPAVDRRRAHRQLRHLRRHAAAGVGAALLARGQHGVPGARRVGGGHPAVDRAGRPDGHEARPPGRPRRLHGDAGARRAAGVRDRHRPRVPGRDDRRPVVPRGLAAPAGHAGVGAAGRGGAAGRDARARRHAVHQPDHARVDGRGARVGVRDHGPPQGAVGADGDLAPRRAERDRAGHPGLGAADGLDGGRRRGGGVRLLLPRHRRRAGGRRGKTATCPWCRR